VEERTSLRGTGEEPFHHPNGFHSQCSAENWTLSFFEAVNFGAFVEDPIKTQMIAKQSSMRPSG
jgi:hypothetical protein